uniref:Uncharacterized protein n=1 Tax=Macrostomum lignano TaxID=282301 RepID=A0A1I8F867_9PLAT
MEPISQKSSQAELAKVFPPKQHIKGARAGPVVRRGGLIKCKSSTECFESWANSDSSSDSSIKYSSGCTACVKWSFLIRNARPATRRFATFNWAKKITQNNLLCYFADDEANIGKKRVWCSKDAGTCYHLEYKNKYNERALAEPSSGVDFAALSQGQPAAVGRVIGPAGSKAARRRTLANATAASDSKDEKKKGAKAKAANQFDYDYDGCGDFRPTAAAVAAMALLWA